MPNQIADIAGADYRKQGFPLTAEAVHLGAAGVDFHPAVKMPDFSSDFSSDFRISND